MNTLLNLLNFCFPIANNQQLIVDHLLSKEERPIGFSYHHPWFSVR